MSADRVLAVVAYKLKFFFAPSLRGRLGPLQLLVLLLLFAPSGLGLGLALGELIARGEAVLATDLLAASLGALLALGLLLALFGGVAAHGSEFDFFMTSPLRPREYLAADLLFQFASLAIAGGPALVVGAIALVAALGGPPALAAALLALLAAYGAFVLATTQVLVVLGAQRPGWPLRAAVLALAALVLLPSLARLLPPPFSPLASLPLPPRAWASVTVGLLGGETPGFPAIAGLVASGTAAGLAWVAVSDAYIFHAVRPLLSVGFGQVSAPYQLEKERRVIRTLGALGLAVGLHPERGGETTFMASLHALRFLRDGSLLIVALYLVVTGLPLLGGAGALPPTILTGLLALPVALLALNWALYERENLWVLLTAGRSPAAYFRGLLVGLTAVGLGVGLVALALLAAAASRPPSPAEAAGPLGGSITAALAATALVARVRLPPGGLSPALPLILLLVSLGGLLGGLAAQGLLAVADALRWGGAGGAALLAAYLVALLGGSLRAVDRLARTFRL